MRIARAYIPWTFGSLVAASGFAGLGYELVWTRQFALVLGTEMQAVLGAVAGFFGGLALGALLFDHLLRITRHPGRAYAALEAAIGVWGLVSIWLLPSAGRLLIATLGPEPPGPLLWGASFALPFITLLPATMAMGGTLTALERLIAEATGNPRLAAGIYGANTLGAVAGALASAYLLMPQLGLAATLAVLAATNLGCAAVALALPLGLPRPTTASDRAADTADPGRPGAPPPVPLRMAFILFGTGLLGIAFEVLTIRLAAEVLQDTVYSFANLLAVYLAGTALGALVWQRIASRRAHASTEDTLAWLSAGVAATCLASLGVAGGLPAIVERAELHGLSGDFVVAILLFLLPSAAMGALFGCLAQATRDGCGSLGRAVGLNAIGGSLAPALASMVLIPSLGIIGALRLVSLGYLVFMPWRRALWRPVLLVSVPALIVLALPPPQLVRVPKGGSILALREGPMVTAAVVRDGADVRYLDINGHFRMGGTSSRRSDYRQAALPILLHPAPKQVLFLGLGTGATMVGATHIPNLSVRGIDLSREVVDLLPAFVAPADLSKAHVGVADARRFIAAESAHYDVIIADLFHPALDGSGALYTREHFAAVRDRLTHGGVFCQWLPLYQLDAPSLQAIIRSFLAVYPDATGWLNHYSVGTPMFALIGHASGPSDAEEITQRLADPAAAGFLQPLGLTKPLDILGQFVAGPRGLAKFAGPGPLNTDDRPFVTFDAERNVRALSAPPYALLLHLMRSIRTDRDELPSLADADTMRRLPAYWAARNRFLEGGAALTGDPRGLSLIEAASPALLDALRISPDFDPAYRPLLEMARQLATIGRPAEARLLLQAVRAAAPDRPEAGELLAALEAK